jgi:hypothetical protein
MCAWRVPIASWQLDGDLLISWLDVRVSKRIGVHAGLMMPHAPMTKDE